MKTIEKIKDGESILEAMETLIKDGVTLTTEEYSGNNDSAFSEFAETNGFDLGEVVNVYNENKSELEELWNQYNNL